MKSYLLLAAMVIMCATLSAQPVAVLLHPSQDPSFVGYVPDEIVVKYKAATPAPSEFRGQPLGASLGTTSLDELSARFGVRDCRKQFPTNATGSMSQYYVMAFNYPDLQAVLNAFAADPNIDHVEPIGICRIDMLPNDPGFAQQWHLQEASDHDIDAPEAWDQTTGGPTMTLAILDTGVRYFHKDLGGDRASYADPLASAGDMWINTVERTGTAGVDDDGNGYVDDWIGCDFVASQGGCLTGEDCTTADNDPRDFNGHGTHCAGIAGAINNNGVGVSSPAGGFGTGYSETFGYGVKIMALRIGYTYSDGYGYVRMDYAASAFAYAAAKGVKVASCSWGSSNSGGLGAAVDNFIAQGGIVFKAAGNSNNESADYLCSRTDVVSVASTTSTDCKSSFSSYGTWVDISAPGSSIYSTYHDYTDPAVDHYATLSGTSMATPLTAGVAALLWYKHPSWSRLQIIDRLLSTTDPIDGLSCNTAFAGKLGSGRLNASAAVGAIPCDDPELWQQTQGTSWADEAMSIDSTTDGGYLLAGRIGPYDMAATDRDMILRRLNACGEIAFTKVQGGTSTDDLAVIRVTSSDGGFIVGGRDGTESNSMDYYVGKFGSTGQETWSYRASGALYQGVVAIEPANDGGYACLADAGSNATRLIKLTTSGSFSWSDLLIDNWDGYVNYTPQALVEESNGDLVALVNEYDTDFDEATVSLYRWSSSGGNRTRVYAYTVQQPEGHSLLKTSDGGYLIAGSQVNASNPSQTDLLLLKLNSSFQAQWTKAYAYGNATQARQLAGGGYAVTGGMSWCIGDAKLLRLDANGDSLWSAAYGSGTPTGHSNAIQLSADGGFVIAGMTRQIDAENGDIFVVKVAPEPASPTLLSPANGASFYPTAYVNLDWQDISGADANQIVLDNNSDFSSPISSVANLLASQWQTPGLGLGTYYWRARAKDKGSWGIWSSTRQFSVINPPPPDPSCPVLFTFDGQEFIQQEPLLTGCERYDYKQPVQDYYVVVRGLEAVNGKVHLQLRELEDEVSFVESLGLIAVEHPADVTITCTESGSISGSTDYVLPVRAVDDEGEDRLAAISQQDDLIFSAKESGSLTLTFPPLEDATFILRTDQPPKQACRELTKLRVDDPALVSNRTVTAEVLQNGQWVTIGSMSPRENSSPGTVSVDLSALGFNREDSTIIKLSWTGPYSTDAIRQLLPSTEELSIVDLSPDAISLIGFAGSASKPVQVGEMSVLQKGDILDAIFSVPSEGDNNHSSTYIVKAFGRYEPLNKQTGLKPTQFALYPNYPNPFNPSTTISYDLPRTTEVTVEIFNMIGQSVRRFVEGHQEAGRHSIEWNGKDNSGNTVSSGVYFYRLSTSEFSDTRKMTLIK